MEKTTEQAPKKKGWRWGTNRWIVLGLLILGVFTVSPFVGLKIQVLSPIVRLPAENLTDKLFTLPWGLGDFYLTNTLVALLIVMLLVTWLAWSFQRAVKREGMVLKGIPGALAELLEYLYNMTESTAGKWAWTIFPYFVTITLMVLVANWMELIPGVDSIGLIKASETGIGYTLKSMGGFIAAVVAPAVQKDGFEVVPFVRVLSTDLNFTVALALIAVVSVQIVGVRAQGMQYFTKFWNVKTFFSKPIFGFIDWGVGLLELISEISKVLSFAFRLFGNIFAGSVLLFVMGSLLGWASIVPSMFYMLEFFVGAIQAIVFGLLTMTFMAQATQGHGEHSEAAQS